MIKYNAYYIDGNDDYKLVGSVADSTEAAALLKGILKEKSFKSYYCRMWIAESKEYGFLLKYDFGSWSEFFAVQFNSQEEAHAFLN